MSLENGDETGKKVLIAFGVEKIIIHVLKCQHNLHHSHLLVPISRQVVRKAQIVN